MLPLAHLSNVNLPLSQLVKLRTSQTIPVSFTIYILSSDLWYLRSLRLLELSFPCHSVVILPPTTLTYLLYIAFFNYLSTSRYHVGRSL